ncbi:protein-glutamate O-methyltransferase CheR [Rhodocytophaga aerolata]|uniref:Protein-glutamate O-methyltransferase CheR n=1 Tax=Rhodocytophaga aerolata TaxID=455078 RepID=A0ABT8R4S5_9BACT|nr:protein-glutamate O-methyltransferase CheR [Rhodocytophaga aerolata]MDO1446696.1 protein-glutamate O-methyltransferase CheR [Rhodocytophaga aerolata]
MVDITDDELQSLIRVILTRYGIDFTSYETGSLKRRIARAITVFNVESVVELWNKLLKERDFIYPFIDELTVGMTAMFRDPVLWSTLKNSVLNQFSQQENIHIWHAGCSTGEEVYTMGIVLSDMQLQHKTSALATDLNQTFIRQAQEGKYHLSVLEDYARNFTVYQTIHPFHHYYTLQEDAFCMNRSLTAHVQFKNHNLVMEKMDHKFDIIFCRNVMIYFDSKAKTKLLEQFHQNLKEGGYLIIGFYDALMPFIDTQKFAIYDLNAKIFRKIS